MSRVVIVGGGITGLAAAWELQQQGVEYTLLEASSVLGGKIVTERIDGFIIEAGADSFVTQKPAGWQLCHEIGLSARLIGTNDRQRNVFVLRGGRLHRVPRGVKLIVPTDPDGLMESDLFSPEGKRRMLAEAGLPPRAASGDESLASFLTRRFGPESLQVFGDMLAGIYTGDPATLSMQATFPNYLHLEQKYGSVIRGTLDATPPPPPPGMPSSAFVSLRGGMRELIEALAARLTGDLRPAQSVSRINPDGSLRLHGGETLRPEAIILTTPARLSAALLAELSPPLSQGLLQVKTLSSATVSLAYNAAELEHDLDGFGFVVAHGEPTPLRASTWSSTKLEGRAPPGFALLRVFLGGYRRENEVDLPDDRLLAIARTELNQIMGIRANPVLTRIYRWRQANTQYEVGHVERVAHFRSLCPPWLHLTGSPYGGVGIPDCIRQGRETARQVVQVAGRV